VKVAPHNGAAHFRFSLDIEIAMETPRELQLSNASILKFKKANIASDSQHCTAFCNVAGLRQ
jgi:hypothetical protein